MLRAGAVSDLGKGTQEGKQMTNYIVVQEVSRKALMELVNSEMKAGRIPLGGPFVWQDPEEGKPLLCQAMIYAPKGNLPHP